MPAIPDPPNSPIRNRSTIVHWNGELTEAPVISPWDPGFLLGLGAFETLPLVGGIPICLSRHHRRLSDGASALGLIAPSLPSLRAAITETAKANGLTDARVRITITGDPSASVPPSTLVSAQPLAIPTGAASAIASPFRRNPASPIAGIKSTSYAESALGLRFAKAHGADEAIFCDHAGNLSEASSSNLFFVKGGRLHTPPISTGCLPGITREIILEFGVKEWGRPVDLNPTLLAALREADEAFLTSSIRGVQALASVDGIPFPSTPGPVTTETKSWLEWFLTMTPDP